MQKNAHSKKYRTGASEAHVFIARFACMLKRILLFSDVRVVG
jgi:hypothetical protein